jgi:hypothetical protein
MFIFHIFVVYSPCFILQSDVSKGQESSPGLYEHIWLHLDQASIAAEVEIEADIIRELVRRHDNYVSEDIKS